MTSIERYAKHIRDYEGRKPWLRARGIARLLATTGLLPLEARKAQRLLQNKKQPLRLHLGCGSIYLDGWVNIDLVSPPGKRRDLRWDLQRRIPFPDESIEAIFSEHLLEHLEIAAGFAHLKECRRVLTPGGVLRIGVPDLERYVYSYLGENSLIEDERPGRPTRGIAFGEIFFFYEHKAMYDFETLELMLREVGFEAVKRTAFGEGKLTSIDSESRRLETLYVEAVK